MTWGRIASSIAAVAVGAATTGATTLPSLSAEELLRRCDVVAVVEITSAEPNRTPEGQCGWRYAARVVERIRGLDADAEEIVFGPYQGREIRSRYLVFLTEGETYDPQSSTNSVSAAVDAEQDARCLSHAPALRETHSGMSTLLVRRSSDGLHESVRFQPKFLRPPGRGAEGERDSTHQVQWVPLGKVLRRLRHADARAPEPEPARAMKGDDSIAEAAYEEVVRSGVPTKVLWEVIARRGRSKKYSDLLPLDGGTVGIAHFAVGGLAALYREMDVQRYFGKTADEMIACCSRECRPSGRGGNDTGWGCHSQDWWRQGMEAFLASPESSQVQDAAWLALMKPVLLDALQAGWTTPRQWAIALGIANSLGAGGFRSLAAARGWDAERTLAAYASGSAHRQRRRQAIDASFPPDL